MKGLIVSILFFWGAASQARIIELDICGRHKVAPDYRHYIIVKDSMVPSGTYQLFATFERAARQLDALIDSKELEGFDVVGISRSPRMADLKPQTPDTYVFDVYFKDTRNFEKWVRSRLEKKLPPLHVDLRDSRGEWQSVNLFIRKDRTVLQENGQ